MSINSLRQIRESLLISKAELARSANLSELTLTRIESGMPCRIETKRKILLALGLKVSDRDKVFHYVKNLYQIVKENSPASYSGSFFCKTSPKTHPGSGKVIC